MLDRPIRWAIVLGALHCLVDGACLAVLFNTDPIARIPDEHYKTAAILYNGLAFGLQLPLGWLADRVRAYSLMAVLGLTCVVAGLIICPLNVHVAVVLVALGNALFHVGAGALVLRSSLGCAAPAGVYVAPGALGVFLGIRAGLGGFHHRYGVIAALALSAFGLFARPFRTDVVESVEVAPSSGVAMTRVLPCLALLAISVTVRSLSGGTLNGLWSQAGPWMALALALAAMVGKAAGGFLADRFGWRFMVVTALAGLAGLIHWAPVFVPLAVIAALLLQTTMAVTLAAMYAMIPGRSGLAFGLPSMALLVGAMPSAAFSPTHLLPWVWPSVLLAIATSYIALGNFKKGSFLGYSTESVGGFRCRHGFKLMN